MAEINIKPWYRKWWGILIIIILTFILITFVALGFYIYHIVKTTYNNSYIGKISPQNTELNNKERALIEGQGNYWLGSNNPKITIVEFSDFACPYCKNSFPKIREIGLKYKSDIKYIYRDMPLRENSLDLAMAARCAGEQGLFWPMHDKLFQNQGASTGSDLLELANQIGAEKNKLKNCFETKKYLAQIQKDFSDGESLGVKGTPTWFINGNKVEGDMPMSAWEEIISKLLDKK